MKKFILALVAIFATFTMFAQNQTVVEDSKLFDNTSISVYGGGLGWINPAVTNSDTFIDGVRGSMGVALGKWITPAVGVEAFYETSVNSLPFSNRVSRWTAFDMQNLGLNGQLNLNNLFHGYKGLPDRVEIVPFAGIGWMHGYTNSAGSTISTPEYSLGGHAPNFISANFGQAINFNMGKQRAWQINIRPSLSYMIAGEGNRVQFNSDRAYTVLQFGLTYKFGHKTSTGAKTHNFTLAYPEAVYLGWLADYKDLKAKYDAKPKEVETIVEKVVEKEVEKLVYVEPTKTAPIPHFVKNLAIVDATSLSLLDELAEEMKSNDNNYILTGYASLEGSEAVNNSLSLKRATAIKNCLIDRGVSANRLTVVGAGATDKFGPTYEANRRVVVEVE